MPTADGVSRPASSALWPSVWLAITLVGAKAAHWSVPPLTRDGLSAWWGDLLPSIHADLFFALGFFVVTETLLRLLARQPRTLRIARPAVVAFGALCVFYGVASVQIFAYLRSPLTYPLLYLAGDMGSMRSSVGSFVTVPVVAALVGVPALYLAAVFGMDRLLPTGRSLRWTLVEVLGAVILWAVALQGQQVAEGRWKDRDDRLIAASPHWILAASYAREVLGG